MRVKIDIYNDHGELLVQGSSFSLIGAEEELEKMARWYAANVCEYCEGTGVVEEGELDNFTSKACVCTLEDKEEI